MTDRKVILAMTLVNDIFLPGNKYEMKINKLPKMSERTFLKFKDILNRCYRGQTEIAFVCLKKVNSSVNLRVQEWGVLAKITGLSFDQSDSSPVGLKARITERCKILSFFQNKEQDDCFFAEIEISPVLAVSEAEWQSNEIQKLKNDIVADFYEFSAVCEDILKILSANQENLDQRINFQEIDSFILIFQKIVSGLELCPNFEEFIKIINRWLDWFYSMTAETNFDIKFYFLSLDSGYEQMLAIKEMINKLIGAAKEKLAGLEEDFSSSARQKISERLEEILKKLNALKKDLSGGREDDEIK